MKKRTSAIREKRSFRTTLINLKSQITSEDLVETGDGLKSGLDVTIGYDFEEVNNLEWNYQTGDNSFSGSAYLFPNWVTLTLFPNSNCSTLSSYAVDEIIENESHAS
jgi:hypothetical protein